MMSNRGLEDCRKPSYGVHRLSSGGFCAAHPFAIRVQLLNSWQAGSGSALKSFTSTTYIHEFKLAGMKAVGN